MSKNQVSLYSCPFMFLYNSFCGKTTPGNEVIIVMCDYQKSRFSHGQSFVFTSSFSVSVVQYVSVKAPVSIVSEGLLKAQFGQKLLWLCHFPVFGPTVLLWGPYSPLKCTSRFPGPRSAVKKRILKKNMYLWLSGPAFLFLPNPKNLQYVPCGYTFESKIGHFLFFLKARSQDTPFLERSLWTLWTWICSWRLLRAEQTVYLEVQSD